jgi:hypothetical protein
MRALTLSWIEGGGQVLGLAPSAAAAAVLGEQTGIRTDTLAKLTWSLRNGGLPDWAMGVGPATLMIIDEAGMADTLSLDTAVRFALDRGASVRLIGDDQQLAAIGAGGVLRDRRLRLSATDWVKNGDRWTITHVDRSGGLTIRHSRSQLNCQLPADYVTTSTGLGYATTIHGAQGVSADTMHGLLTGQESRPQLYTMLTRGRHANHLYLQVVGDGDPHSLIRPETVAPPTPTETLQQILGRDDTLISASSLLRQLNDPAARLLDAVQRYTDGLHVAAEQLVGSRTLAELDRVDKYVPGLTDEPAWPTLRAHLIDLAAETGKHPLRHLQEAASGRDLSTAGDMAAVLYWRLTALPTPEVGPLPWLPQIPHAIQDHPAWGNYLAKRAQHVAADRHILGSWSGSSMAKVVSETAMVTVCQ